MSRLGAIDDLVRASRVKCIFLDRDGTLIRHLPYLSDPGGVQLLPTVVEGLNELVSSGCKLFLHTNQSGVGRGYFPLAAALACTDEMLRQIGLGHELFEDICVCPEAPDEDIRYRKPSPRYGLEIIEKYAVAKSNVCYVGDNITDLLTARNIGCMGIGVNTGQHDLRKMLRESDLEREFPVFDSFIEAARHVVGHVGRADGAG